METENNSTVTNPNEMSVVERVKAPTPPFFKSLRTIGIALATIGGVLLAAPLALPAGLIAVVGYITLAGSVLTAVSQTAVDSEPKQSTVNETP